MPDCGSGSFWFESRYLPFKMWKVRFQKCDSTIILKIKSVTYFLNLLQFNRSQLLIKLSVLNKMFSLTTPTIFDKNSSNLKQINYSSKFIIHNARSQKANYTTFNSWGYNKNSLITKFISVNLWLPTKTLEVHPSFSLLYHYNNQSNLGVFNLKKVFNTWLNVLNFLNNVLLHNLSYLFFSSSYFKYESLAINWGTNKKLKSLWRYTNPFIFFLKNKTTRDNDIFFKYINRRVSKLAILVDIYYHKRTLYYFSKYKYITLGPVPVTSSLYSLTLAFPVSSNSVFSNLFFIRMFFRLNKLFASYYYKQLNTYKI